MQNALVARLRRHRIETLAVVDITAWVIAFYVCAVIRFDTLEIVPVLFLNEADGHIALSGVLVMAGVASLVHIGLASLLRLNQGRHEVASFEEFFTLMSVVATAGAVAIAVNLLVPDLLYPRLSVPAAVVVALALMAWPRALWRIHKSRRVSASEQAAEVPVLIAGAGASGRTLVRSMDEDPHRAWRPVAFIDDDRRKRHYRYRGISVEGKTRHIAKVAEAHGAQTIIIAMPSVSAEVIRGINDAATDAGLDVKVLPGVNQLLGAVSVEQVRDIEPADLLGRHQIKTDVESIAHYLRDQAVLVTGAGGSIGSELCRQIRRFAPARLLMLDRDESALHALALMMDGRADLESPDMVLADIRDRDRLFEVFAEHRPQVVFHAAALKHVNILEGQPREAIKTNVLGTRNVLDAAVATGVHRFVNISTDKAAEPENVLGYSKRLAEGLTAGLGHEAPGTYLSVRFGNVLGTRGSVLTTFTSQIARGGPVTVTHPDVTRFFMTVDEAVQLVIQAAAIGRDGEALVLDMGSPVKIDDVARQMIKQSHQPIEIVYTGLKPGEKLHEVLFASEEADARPFHPLVSHVAVPPATAEEADHVVSSIDPRQALESACMAITADHVAQPVE